MGKSPAELLAAALEAGPDTAQRILYGAAAFDALTDADMVLVGGGAQLTHTGIGRITDVDLVGVVTAADELRLEQTGFQREGRHWVFEAEGGAIAIEVAGSGLSSDEAFEEIDLEGAVVRVISATDLMMDRLLQATDGTQVTRDEATQLAIAAADRIDWESIEERGNSAAATGGSLRELPRFVAELRSLGGH